LGLPSLPQSQGYCITDYGKNQLVMLHKKLGEKIAETGYFAESCPGTHVEGQLIFVQIAQIPTFFIQNTKKSPHLGRFPHFFGFLFAISVIS
jgi:hypothetical protein